MGEQATQDGGVPARQSAEYVYRRVRNAILDAELAPGETMSQVALADELGVSRTPLREALRMLQGEGLIEARANRRVRVAPMSVDDLEELAAVRVVLEAQALRLAVPRMTSEHVARLEGSIAEMAHYHEQVDMRRWLVPHAEYHRQLTELAGGRFAVLLSQMFDHHERYRRLHVGTQPSAQATVDHRGILDAVKLGDGPLAGRRLAEHLSRVAFEVAEILEPGRELATLHQVLVDVGAEVPRRSAGAEHPDPGRLANVRSMEG
jgi:DNA-binding GntR family transcriptional regulator